MNRNIILKYVKAFNAGDLEGVCKLFTPDAQIYGVLGWGRIEVARPIWEQLITCFKINLRVEGMVEENDTIAVRYVERGTFAARFRNFEPTGKSYEVNAIEWFVFKDKLIHQRWGARDSAAIFRQGNGNSAQLERFSVANSLRRRRPEGIVVYRFSWIGRACALRIETDLEGRTLLRPILDLIIQGVACPVFFSTDATACVPPDPFRYAVALDGP